MSNFPFKLYLPVLIFSSGIIVAEEAEERVSVNVNLTTDYVFRGQSQTGEHGAIQGGLDYSSESGFYAGIWVSNVDFDSSAQAEVDFYGGYSGSLSESVDYNLGYIYYSYIGESALDYQELTFSVDISGFSLGLYFSDEYLGDEGENFYYLTSGYSVSLPQEYTLDLQLGLNHADGMDITFDDSGDDNYIDWSAVLSKTFADIDLSLGYYDTDISAANELADGRLILSVSRSL